MSGVGPGRRVGVVVLVDTIRRPGGAESLAMEGAIGLDRERFDVTLCVTRWSDDLELEEPSRTWLGRLRAANVRVLGLRRPGRFALWSWLPLLGLLRRERIDVLHGHLLGSNVWACLLGRLARVPVIVAHEHMWAYSSSRLRPLIDRELIARLSSAFIAVSDAGRRRMIEVERIAPEDIVLIRNGAAELPAGRPGLVRGELKIPADAPVLGSVGHLRREKAFEVLIEAAALLRAKLPGLRVIIAGEGPCRKDLEDLRDRLGLNECVHLLGARTDVPDVLAALDVAVCCSDFEGGPLSVIEYMGAGLPVIATDVGGLPEMIRDGVTGRLVEPRNPAALGAVAGELLTDAEQAARLGAAGGELRRAEYGLRGWVRRIEELYLSLLSRARPARLR